MFVAMHTFSVISDVPAPNFAAVQAPITEWFQQKSGLVCGQQGTLS